MSAAPADTAGRAAEAGLAAALLAYFVWGLSPLYWKYLSDVDAMQTLAHRYLWTLPLTFVAMAAMRLWPELRALAVRPRHLGLLAVSATMVAINSGTYLWGVNHDRVVEASLGYFLTPLLTVLFGLLLFRESLRPWQWVAVGLAAAGVANLVATHGIFPWVGLVVGASFATYGAVRKLVPIGSVAGFFAETALIAPVALVFLAGVSLSGDGAFGGDDPATDLLLVGGGLVTAVPFLLYVVGARRLRLSTVGLLFYINPSLQFLVGVFVFGEPVTQAHLVTFGLIWTGLAVYSVESRLRMRRAAAVL